MIQLTFKFVLSLVYVLLLSSCSEKAEVAQETPTSSVEAAETEIDIHTSILTDDTTVFRKWKC